MKNYYNYLYLKIMNEGGAQKDLSKILEPFENEWVAISSDQDNVLASGESLREVESKLDKSQIHEVIFYKVPPFSSVFIPTIL